MYFNYFLKKFVTPVFLLFVLTISAFSQNIDFGLRGGLASAWLLNGNISKSGTDQNYALALSYNYGVQMAMNFHEKWGVEINILEGTLTQGYSGTFSSSGELHTGSGINYYPNQSYTSTTQINVIEIPILFRYEQELTGRYVEVGGAYEGINSASYTSSYLNPAESFSEDITSQLPNENFLLIAGCGWDKKFSHESNFYFMAGLRVEYGLFDLQGVDAHGQDLTGARSVILYEKYIPNPYYTEYHSTHCIDLNVNMGVFYRFYPKAFMHKRRIDF